MGRPKVHGPETAELLLDSAQRLLSSHGETAVSVRALADAVGVTARAVYSSFGSIDGLLASLAARGFDDLRRRLEALPISDDPEADLIAVGTEGYRRWALADPAMYRLCFDRLPTTAAGAREANRAAARALVELERRVQRVRTAAGITDRSVRELAVQFHALCEGLVAVELRDGLLGRRPAPIVRDALVSLVRGWALRP